MAFDSFIIGIPGSYALLVLLVLLSACFGDKYMAMTPEEAVKKYTEKYVGDYRRKRKSRLPQAEGQVG